MVTSMPTGAERVGRAQTLVVGAGEALGASGRASPRSSVGLKLLLRSRLDDDDDESYFDEDDDNDGPVVSKEVLEEMSKSSTSLSQESSGLAAVLNTYEDVDKVDMEGREEAGGMRGDLERESAAKEEEVSMLVCS